MFVDPIFNLGQETQCWELCILLNFWTYEETHLFLQEMFLLNFGSSELLAKYVRDLDETRVQSEGPPDVIAPNTGFAGEIQAPTWQ